MGVTEYALLLLRKDGHDDPDLLETLCQTNEVQDQWIDQHQPHLREQDDNHSQFYLHEDKSEPYMLITAPWDSPEGHKAWIQSKENQEAMTKLVGPFLVEGDTDLFHMEAAVDSPQMPLKGAKISTRFNVTRLDVDAADRDAVQKEFQRLRDIPGSSSSKSQVWAGWKIEKTDKLESLIIFWIPVEQSPEVTEFLTKHGRHETRTFRR